MLRRALLLSVALAGLVGCTNAWAARTTIPVRGDVRALALAGDAVVAVRETAAGNLRLERLAPGAPAQTLLRVPLSDDDYAVMLSASAQALAVSVATNGGEDAEATHVWVGRPTGPLREVAACETGLVLSPVATAGNRVAWTSGGCGAPPDEPVGATPATIVIAGADPAAPVSLVPVPAESLPTAIRIDEGLVGLIRPSFFVVFKSEVRTLVANQIGATVLTENSGIALPIGVLPTGERVFAATHDGDDDEADDEGNRPCTETVFAVAPGASERRALPLGGCPTETEFPQPSGNASVVGERVHALVWEGGRQADAESIGPVAVRSVRTNGTGPQLVVRGVFRRPQNLATDDSGRVAWSQPDCTGGAEIVVEDGTGPAGSQAIRSCNLRVLTRRARVSAGRITVRVRCPSGCTGGVFARDRLVGPFSRKAGTHRLRLRLTPRERRAKRLRLNIQVDSGPGRNAVIRLR